MFAACRAEAEQAKELERAVGIDSPSIILIQIDFVAATIGYMFQRLDAIL